MKVTFDHSEDTAKGIKTFFFMPEQPVRYIAGQFVELQIPHNPVDSRGDKRWFTLSSTPSEPLLAITTALSGDQSSSFKRELSSLAPGAAANISLPMGDFVLPKDTTIPLIFIAGGIGITPFKSIITELNYRQQSRDITLLYASHTNDEIAFRDALTPLGGRFITMHSNDESGDNYGTLSAHKVIELTQPTDQHYIYVSGPEAMVEILTKDLAAHGIERRRIFTDYFHGYIES